MANVYKQGIGRLAYKLQDGGPVVERTPKTNDVDALLRKYAPIGGLGLPGLSSYTGDMVSEIYPAVTRGMSAFGASMAPGAGVADYIGQLPDMQGGKYPSFPENIEEGRYLDAGLQTLGVAGDAAYGLGPLGVAAGIVAKTPRAVKAALSAARMEPPSLPITPAKENLQTVLDSNFYSGRVVGDEIVPIDSLRGGATAYREVKSLQRVSDLVEEMRGPDGYIERLIVDQDGYVVEGQHRLSALRELGEESVPITRVADNFEGLDLDKVREAIGETGKWHPDQKHYVMQDAAEMLREDGSVKGVLDAYGARNLDIHPAHIAAMEAMESQRLPMDTASRMKRAEEMGFDTDEKLYTGFVPYDNIEELAPETWFSDVPEVAGEYAFKASNPGEGVIVPAFIRGKQANLEDPNIQSELFKRLRDDIPEGLSWADDAEAIKWAQDLGFDPDTAQEARDMVDWQVLEGHLTGGRLWDAEGLGNRRFEGQVIAEIQDMGFESVRIPDATFGRPNSSVVVFDPANTRSRFAKFDPAKKDLPGLSMRDGGVVRAPGVYQQGIGKVAYKLQAGGTIPGDTLSSILDEQMANKFFGDSPVVERTPKTGDVDALLRRYVPPHLRESLGRIPEAALAVSDFVGVPADIKDMKHYSGATMDSLRDRNYSDALANTLMTGAALGMTALPGSVGGIDKALKKASGDLPMDTPSRMKRAEEMGFNRDVYHGTNQPDITELQSGDIGIHVGDETAANVRLNDKAALSRGVNRYSTRGKDFGDNANILPLKVKSENPLRMDDAGEWRDPIELAKGLRTSAIGSKDPTFNYEEQVWTYGNLDIHKRLDDIQENAETIQRSYSDGWDQRSEDYLSDPEIMGMVDELREVVKGAGYDSIVYRNFTEATSQSGSDSLILLDPSQARSRFAEFDPAKKDLPGLSMRDGGVVPEIEKRLVDGPESKEIWQRLGQKGGGNVPDSFTSDLDADQYKKGIEESILSGDKAWATITHIADTSPDPELATLARKLAPHVLDVTTNMRNSGDIFNLAGRFTPSERHIKLFDPQLRLKYDNISSGVSEGTAIHEALHAALRTKEATLNSDAWAEVEQVYKELQRRYRGMKTSSKDDIVAKSMTSSRTLYDSPEHMLINALTDKETQEFLKQVPGRESERRAQMLGGSSLWDGILNYVIKALDLDYTDVTALDSVLTVSKKVLDELDSQVPRPTRKPSQVGLGMRDGGVGRVSRETIPGSRTTVFSTGVPTALPRVR